VSKVGATQYWTTMLAEYKVGAATSAPPVMLTAADNPPATYDDSQIESWLASKLNADDPAWPKPDANTIYALFFPDGVTITMGGGGGPGDGGAPDAGGGGFQSSSCTSFGGYHANITLDGAHNNMDVAYAVLPRCATFGNLSGVDAITAAASHEFAESATDPFPADNPAYTSLDVHHGYWSRLLGGSEIGDMCAQNDSAFVKFPELPDYTVQRCWSNAAAMMGGDPCVPLPKGEVYFNAIPVMPDTVTTTTFGGANVTYKGVQIPVGMSKTIELDLFSSGPTKGPWTVDAVDSGYLRTGTAQLKFTFDKKQGQNGDKIHMTIEVLAAGRRKNESFLIISTLGSVLNGPSNLWAGVVGN
jgi:hypothetical protein